MPRILFVTGKLAEPALRRTLADLALRAGFEADVAVLPITVAALLTTDWVARHLAIPAGTDRIVLPGLCRGDLQAIAGPGVERGPDDLRDLPEYFGEKARADSGYGKHDIEIIAEINHAPQRSLGDLLAEARQLHAAGADVVDVGCDPGSTWAGVREAVHALRAEGLRVSIDSFDPVEVERALAGGAELVLSVNGSNVATAREWHERYRAEVVAIPDTPTDLESLQRTVDRLESAGVRYRLDPILEPIGMGFAASLGRYLETRRRYPSAAMMMGVGNLTELTDADSAGLNVMLLGFCQELGIRSVLTTQVAPWCATCVRELDLARRLVFHAVNARVPPKRLEPGLIMLRDPKVRPLGEAGLQELARHVVDRNYRIFAERGELHVINGSMHLRGGDPFAIFEEMVSRDASMDASHAFYLGYELAKAVTALTLGKSYTQDRELRWGLLTVPDPGSAGK